MGTGNFCENKICWQSNLAAPSAVMVLRTVKKTAALLWTRKSRDVAR